MPLFAHRVCGRLLTGPYWHEPALAAVNYTPTPSHYCSAHHGAAADTTMPRSTQHPPANATAIVAFTGPQDRGLTM
eukprot:4630442-Amphidinium_carterae.1